MHAVVVQVSIDESRFDEAQQGLKEFVVPNVSSQPGFVSGTWAHQRAANRGMGMALYESEQAANDALAALAEMRKLPERADDPVTIQSAEVYEVAAQA
jgi:hypothetical protein